MNGKNADKEIGLIDNIKKTRLLYFFSFVFSNFLK